jgi:multidrug resistance efflux pump
MKGSLFRILRVTIIMLVLISTIALVHTTMTTLKSEQAVINAEILQVRTPIEGLLEMGDVRPGTLLKKGDVLFKMVNPRFVGQESVSQFNILQNMVESVRSDLVTAHHTCELATIEKERSTILYNKTLIARVEVEDATARLSVAKDLVRAREEQLSRGEKRAIEMAAQMEMQKNSVVLMPEDGLVWSVEGKTGEQMEATKLVVEIINPRRMWVDAFFSERHAKRLKTGLTAGIRSLDSEAEWDGTLESVRAGVGRMSFDNTVAVPPPEMVKRQIAVRVKPDWDRPFLPAEFFGVGRSVEVCFDDHDLPRTNANHLRQSWNQLVQKFMPDGALSSPTP